MPNKWIEHIKKFAKDNNVSYGCALSMPKCKESYKKTKSVTPVEQVKSVEPVEEKLSYENTPKKEQARLAKLAKLQEDLYKLNQGKGVFSGDTFNPIASLKERKKKIIEGVKTAISGNIGLPLKVRNIIEKYGDKNITGIKLHRTPLSNSLMSALNIASANTLQEKLKNAPYDKLFHLFMCIETADGNFLLEKNEVINADENCKLPPNTETKIVTEIPSDLKVNQAIDKTKAKLGDKFLSYSANDNNCQHFIASFLEVNGIGNSSDLSFVKQDTEQLFKSNPVFRKIVNSVTKLGSAMSNITGLSANTEGSGIFDSIKAIGEAVSKPYEISGVNPFNLGYNLGENVIAPELMKVVPPEKVNKVFSGKGTRKKISINNIMSSNKKPNAWIQHVKDYASKNGVSYKVALKDSACKSSYVKTGKGMPTSAETMIAQISNSENLGANMKGL